MFKRKEKVVEPLPAPVPPASMPAPPPVKVAVRDAFEIARVATATEDVIVFRETGEQLTIVEALAEALNGIEEIKQLLKG